MLHAQRNLNFVRCFGGSIGLAQQREQIEG